ncbi:MAG: glycosyltransferase family 4 protein [Candidatus Dormibacteria bacterium]|jgi:glycosyltransferase involved in cell wall biosynthesis
MRVAWFGHAGGRRADGLTSYSDLTVRALVAAGCEIRFFHHDLDGDVTAVPDAVSLEGVRFKTVTLPAPRTLARIERALADFRPDVVHCSVSVSLLDGAVARVARGLGAVTVATCHLPYAPAQSARGRVMRRLYQYHAARLQEYDRCIALSHDQRDLLVRAGVAAERIVVMPNAVDTGRISPGPSALKQTLGATLLVSFLGRLDPEKRVEELIHSFLARRWPSDHLLVIAGSGSQDRRLRAIAGPEGPVRFLGMVTRVEDRLELLRATDVFVLPSTAEGLSLALLEAMAAGCAIVATDAGEHGAVLDGAGLVIPVHPLEPALGEALERLGADPQARRKLGEAARGRAVAQHGLDAYVVDLLHLYASAAAGRQAAGAVP